MVKEKDTLIEKEKIGKKGGLRYPYGKIPF